MKRRHGPDLKLAERALDDCQGCKGEGFTMGLLHEMACFACAGAGLVEPHTGAALQGDDLVLQLRLRLTQATNQNRSLREQLERSGIFAGPAQDYVGTNRRGAGGSHWTGD